MRVLLGFGHSRDPDKAHDLPSVRAFEREVVAFRARYPWIRDYLTWNEANHCSQPTCRNPERGGAVLPDDPQALPGLPDRRGRRARRHEDGRLGQALPEGGRQAQGDLGPAQLHRRQPLPTTGTSALLKAVKGDVWFTETGGLVMRRNGSTVPSPVHATRGGGDVVGLPPGRALPAREARVLLPLGTGSNPAADLGLRARRQERPAAARLRRPARMAARTTSRADRRARRARARGCGRPSEGGISGGGKVIGRTVTVYSLTPDPAGASRDFVDGEKLALADAGGRAGALAVNFSSLDLGGETRSAGRGRAAGDQRPADHRRDRRRDARHGAAVQRGGDPAGRAGRRRERWRAIRTRCRPAGARSRRCRRRPCRRTSPRASRRRSAASRSRRAGGLPGDGRHPRGDRDGGRGRQRPHPRDRRVLP